MADHISHSDLNARTPSVIQENINNVIFKRESYNKIINEVDGFNKNKLSNIVIRGYAGYGKHQLMNLLAEKCKESGCIVLRGESEQFQSGEPYSLLKKILSSLQFCEKDNAVKNSIKKLNELISKYDLYSFYAMCEELANYHAIEVDCEYLIESKEIFYGVVFDFLKLLAEESHVVIVLDDIQWCDIDTKLLLSFLVEKELKNIHLIISYRSNELSNDKITEELIDNIDNEFSFSENINGFSFEECKEYIVNGIGLRLTDDFIAEVYNRSQGNPFFIKQILTYIVLENSSYAMDDDSFFRENIFESGAYKSLEYYVKKNLKIVSPDYLKILQLLSCIGKPLDISLVSNILKYSVKKIREIIISNQYYKYIVERNDCLFVEHEAITHVAYEAINISERKKIHNRISNELLANNKKKYIFDVVHHLNESKADVSNEDLIGIAGLYEKAADESLAKQSYEISNAYYKRTLDLIDQCTERFDVEIKNKSQYGYIYTAFLLGSSKQLLIDLEGLIEGADKIFDVSKYYALYKDIVVNYGGDYDGAKNKGIDVLRRFGVDVNNELLNFDLLKESIDSINAIEVCAKKINTEKNVSDIDVDSKYLKRLFQDVWEAAYYAQDIEVMNFSIYKIIDISISKSISSESSFGFTMYAMYLTKQGRYDESYDAGLLALNIVDKFNDKVMFPKITNLFCNYSAFYTEKFKNISSRYYESYKVSESTNDLLFGAWAAYFNIWTLYMSGENLPIIRGRCIEVYPFLLKTNDKKMILSFFILFDFINDLINDEKNMLIDKRIPNFDSNINTAQYFHDNLFSPGIAWQSILSSTHCFLFGQYEKVVDNAEFYLSEMNIDIVMFPLTQSYFVESLSLVKLVSEGNKELSQRLSDSLNSLHELSKNAAVNFEAQYNIARLSMYIHNLLPSDELVDIDGIIKNVENKGLCLELGVMYELLVAYHYEKGSLSLAKKFLNKAIDIYMSWGASLKVKQLKYTYSNILYGSTDVNKNKTTEVDINHLVKFTSSLSYHADESSIANYLISIAAHKTLAYYACFISVSEDEYKIVSSWSEGVLNGDVNSALDLCLQNISRKTINYCLHSKTSVRVDSKCNVFDDSYFSTSNISSVMCVPVVFNESVLGLLYLEKNNDLFSNESLNYVDFIVSQSAVSYSNALLYKATKKCKNNGAVEREKLINRIDKIADIHKYANIGIWEWNILTNDIEWSDEIFIVLGFSKEHTKVNYDKFLSVLHPEDIEIVEDAIQYCLDGNDYNVVHRIIRPDGGIRWLSEKGSVIRDANKNPIKMFGVVQDITDKKIAEDNNVELNLKLTQAQKMESIGHLAGGIAHDFNNMLASILGYADLAYERLSPIEDEKIADYLSNISAAGNRASDLVKQMLLFSRKHSVNQETISLVPIVKESLKLLGSTIPSSINLMANISNDIANVSMDAIQAQQIILNLCVNSRDAIYDIGNINVNLKQVFKTEAICDSCHSNISGDFVELSIDDDGGGIDRKDFNKIFDPFFTTKELGKGTGMGLSVVHGIVHSHGGHLHVTTSSRGTKICIYLPAVDGQEYDIEDESINISDAVDLSANIVVVDDEQLVAEYIKSLLELKGAHVTTFTDSVDALAFIKNNLHEVDLLITDMTMPKLNGANLSRQVLEILPDLPIILCTGYSTDMDDNIALEIGIKDYLTKPVDSTLLLESISKLLAS